MLSRSFSARRPTSAGRREADSIPPCIAAHSVRGSVLHACQRPWHTRGVPEYCSCGAKLPEDARFCHKCGKPQRDEPLLSEPEPPPIPVLALPLPVPAQPAAIGFHNSTAVWIALRVALIMFLLCLVLGILSFVWLLAGGFFAVYLYRRRTGQVVTVKAGAHLGWIAGIFGFVMTMVILTMMVLAVSDPENVAKMREQFNSWSMSEEDLNRMIELLHNPSSILAMVLGSFTLFTLLSAAGGAFGAKLLNRN